MENECIECRASFSLSAEQERFLRKISPIFQEECCLLPPPALCPQCRLRRRMSFYNLRRLYARKCSATGRDLISIYSPNKQFPVFANSVWWGDDWNPLDYGRDVDFARPFFEQMAELITIVPRLAIMNDSGVRSENSLYTNDWYNSKNCYFCFSFSGETCQDCYYCTNFDSGHYTDCVDTTGGSNLQLAYECLDCTNCYNCYFCQKCHNSSDCCFCYNLTGCHNCLFSSNLVNKTYYIHNREASAEEYQQVKSKFINGSHYKILEAQEHFRQALLQTPRKALELVACENCQGDNLKNCKNLEPSYNYINALDGGFLFSGADARSCYDIEFSGNTELCYEGVNVDDCYHTLFNSCSWKCSDSYYVDNCYSCQRVFGCVALKKKTCCVLNREYNLADYHKLVRKLVEHMKETGEWGKFFPGSLSPFGYNESVANEYFQLTKAKALAAGFTWNDYEVPAPVVKNTVAASRLPDSTDDISEEILNWAVACETTGRPFRIIKPELAFYRKYQLPLPRLHPDQRYENRLAMRNPRHLWECCCKACGRTVKTTYPPDCPETVYCEECFQGCLS
jgi:hypothetical protein